MPSKPELGQRLTDSVMKMDAAACAACYAPDAELVSPNGVVRGREEIREFFDGWFQAFDDHEITDEFSEEGDVLVCHSVAKLTHVAPATLSTGQTVEATGRRVTVHAVERLTFQDNLIKTHNMEFDPQELADQLTG